MLKIRKSGRGMILATAVPAVLCGCALLVVLGAPQRMPLMNFAALLIGLVAAQIIWLLRGADPRVADWALLGAGLALPLTAVLGPQADGVARWLVVAGLTIQPGMIVVPIVALGLASRPNKLRVAAVGVAALGTALQPDVGAATMLLLGVGAAAIRTRSPGPALASLFALAGTAVAFARPTNLPPVAFVEHVLADSIAYGIGASLLALAGAILLFLPALLARSAVPTELPMAFAGVWAGGHLAALAGPYPTPVIGFGGSAVVGYLLCLSLMTLQPRVSGGHVTDLRSNSPEDDGVTLRHA